jgi:hypothetical protein
VTWRRLTIMALALTLASAARVAAAQASDPTACHGSVERKALAGRVVDAETEEPMSGVYAYLEAQRPDTTFYSNSEVIRGISVNPVFRRRAQLDASGDFCFSDLPADTYRVEVRGLGYGASRQAIVLRLRSDDSLQTLTFRYRRYGRSPEEEAEAAKLLGALDANRRRWAGVRPRHYLLRVRTDCFCFGGPPPTYEVLDEVAVAATDSGGVRHTLGSGAETMTVDSLFDALRKSILDERRVTYAIQYDRRFSFPRHYETGSVTPMNDAWFKVTVERFDVIE